MRQEMTGFRINNTGDRRQHKNTKCKLNLYKKSLRAYTGWVKKSKLLNLSKYVNKTEKTGGV